MDLLTSKIRSTYFKYLLLAFGSAFITSIYSVVDTAMVGKYYGPVGTASLAVVAPIWNIIYSLGLLVGIGGSVRFSMLRGEKKDDNESNQYFTIGLIFVSILAIISWVVIGFFDKYLLILFGADETTLLPLAQEYLTAIKFVIPCFLFNQFFAAFLRNDDDPNLATFAVLFGGIFNIFGDYFFVFVLDMGIFGAGLATAIGSIVSFLLMLTHFFKKKNTLKLVKFDSLIIKVKEISVSGFSSFFVDAAMGILTICFNNQILKYLGQDALSVYGIIINISTFVQCCAYSVGQASQPIISANYGAKNKKRITECLRYSFFTVAFFSVLWLLLTEINPNMFVYIFMTPTDEVLSIAPSIIRKYSISFLLLPLNIFSTYYFQSIGKPLPAFIVSLARGAIISGLLIYVLPLIFTGDILWYVMLITEIVVAVYAIIMIIKCTMCIEYNDIENSLK